MENTEEVAKNEQLLQIEVDKIVPNKFQPRINFDEESLDELAKSIKEHGIIEPLVVRQVDDKYEIIAGERRYRAACMAGLPTVPAVLSNMDDQQSAEVALVENVQRKDLSPIEEAISYQNLLETNNMTQEELAKKMGISQSTIANKLRLLNLSPSVQEALMNGKISERHARSLLSLKESKDQNEWLDRILKERLTVRQLDDLLKSNGLDLDDVPIVNINQNVDDIKTNASDIMPLGFEKKFATPENQDNKFFNTLEDEPISMGSTSPVRSFDDLIFNQVEAEQNEKAEEEEGELGVFDDIEMLDVDDLSAPETPVNTIPANAIKIRDYIKGLEDPSITIEEIDENGTYKINIIINK